MNTALIDILHHLKENRNIDLTGYKETSLERRVNRRMHDLSSRTYSEYLSRLEHDPAEYDELLSYVYINVTRFFRDPGVFAFLADTIVPSLIAKKKRDGAGALRVWCPGCASGEEAFSLALLFRESLRNDPAAPQVIIYGTDSDAAAIDKARTALYRTQDLSHLPAGLIERYFEGSASGDYLKIVPEVRSMVRFGIQNLVSDPPITHLDLLTCRNVLIYFSRNLQARVFPKFFCALDPGGYLLLGSAESLSADSRGLFSVVNKSGKVFQKPERVNRS